MGRKLGGGLCPFGGEELGPHLTQCGQGRGLYCHAKFLLDPSNRLATMHERHRQTGQDRTWQTDWQRTDSIGRTVLQTVAQKLKQRLTVNYNIFNCGESLCFLMLYVVPITDMDNFQLILGLVAWPLKFIYPSRPTNKGQCGNVSRNFSARCQCLVLPVSIHESAFVYIFTSVFCLFCLFVSVVHN